MKQKWMALVLASVVSLSLTQPTLARKPKEARADEPQIQDFRTAKNLLEKKIYKTNEDRVTLYCGYSYNKSKDIDLPASFSAPVHHERSKRVEWEHVVPAENFGRAFAAWREGDAKCYDPKAKKEFKGRRCAEIASPEFATMEGDMYNLFPAVGSVNAIRSNYRYTQFEPARPNTFGSCEMRIDDHRAEPPARARGRIARAMLYMQNRYPEYYQLSAQDQRLADAWNTSYPVTESECRIAARIEQVQKNDNPFVKGACEAKGWYSPQWPKQ